MRARANPEVLYGAGAARTEKIRIGYGVRLATKPYNCPVRLAESVEVIVHRWTEQIDEFSREYWQLPPSVFGVTGSDGAIR